MNMVNSTQLKLKAVWGKNFLGLAIDQVIGSYQLPVTTYYFWPRTEAWEQLRLELELKSWIQEDEKIKVLNSAAQLMNLCMQEYRNKESIDAVKEQFKEITFGKIRN
jgi:30S ribosomal protein 3